MPGRRSPWKLLILLELWPGCVPECDFEGWLVGLKVTGNDIQELLEEHIQELTADKLMELHYKQLEVAENIFSKKEEQGDKSFT